METEKPLISILMAVYEPRMDWLKEQLESLNSQTYPNLRLYIRDDCSTNVPISDIRELAARCVTAFPYSIQRNTGNLGSIRTFERLTEEADGEYFAYCDQDDVWLPEKLSVLEEAIVGADAQLVCSDMFIIDQNGKQTASSITKIRKHHVFRSGEGLGTKLLISNFVTGCTMLVRSAQAKAAAPFCPDMMHDHYLALWCASQGKIISLHRQLIRYRIHPGNQTAMMAGVFDKESYYTVRVVSMVHRLEWLQKRFSGQDALIWARAREQNFQGDKTARRTVMKYRRFSPLTSLFEITMAQEPQLLFMLFINLKRSNIV